MLPTMLALLCSLTLTQCLSLDNLMRSQHLFRSSILSSSLHIPDTKLIDTSLTLSSNNLFGIEVGPTQIIGVLMLSTISLILYFGTVQNIKKFKEEEDNAYKIAETRSRQIREEKENAAILLLRQKELELQQKEVLAKELKEESKRRIAIETAEKAKRDEEKRLLEAAQAKLEADKKKLERLEALKILEEKELKIRLEKEEKAEYEDMMKKAEVAKSRREQEEAAERDWKIKQAALNEATAAKAWKSKQLAAKASSADKQTRLANAEIALAKEKVLTRKLLAMEQEKELEKEEEIRRDNLKNQRILEEQTAAKLWRDKQAERSKTIAEKYSKLNDKMNVPSSIPSTYEEFVIPTSTSLPESIETTPANNVITPVVPLVGEGRVSTFNDPNEGNTEVTTIPKTKDGLSLDESLASFNEIGIDEKTRNEIDKKLNEALTILAKIPTSRLRNFIIQYKPELLKKEEEALGFEDILKLAAEAGWSRSNGDYNMFVDFLDNEFKVDLKEAMKWMRISVADANELTENKIKELILIHGDRDVAPKRKGEKLTKSDLLGILLEVLRFKFKNDYREVAMFLGSQKSIVNSKKGFGNKK